MIASTGNVDAEDFVEDQLGSPAAKQQLIEQYSDSDGYNLDGRTVSQGYSQTKGHPYFIN
ncbi:hypothetical protein UMM65_00365 [Aureibaculum sp. 2210JD6-5]|uniref:hypothetical protein n=1 Tax=Aureibaculum sp. 2210JD6-5 TaxID=3103957 RepID=UPI002AAD1010|nr:hypothetical protein [Aureibaculum sp. 2210JD6-5]MDY7393682.1 hypothetical protein [Aureibaculum sp. 2210JD6-5]